MRKLPNRIRLSDVQWAFATKRRTGAVAPAAFALPVAGEWGTAARNSITGPSQFSFNTGLARTILWGNRLTFEWHLDATNILNRVTYSGENTTVGSPQFGLPNRANPMRKVQSSLRMRF